MIASVETAATAPSDGAVRRLSWLAFALFVAYLGIAMALPVVLVFVTRDLGQGAGLAGLAVGIAALLSFLIVAKLAREHRTRRAA